MGTPFALLRDRAGALPRQAFLLTVDGHQPPVRTLASADPMPALTPPPAPPSKEPAKMLAFPPQSLLSPDGPRPLAANRRRVTFSSRFQRITCPTPYRKALDLLATSLEPS